MRRTTFLYFGCAFVTATLTTIVLSPLSETTTPRRSWRRPSSDSGFGVARDRLARRAASRASASSACGAARAAGASSPASRASLGRRCGCLGGGLPRLPALRRCCSGLLGGASSATGSSASAAGSSAAAGASALGDGLLGGSLLGDGLCDLGDGLLRLSGRLLGSGFLGGGSSASAATSASARPPRRPAPRRPARPRALRHFGDGLRPQDPRPRSGASSAAATGSVSSAVSSTASLHRGRLGRRPSSSVRASSRLPSLALTFCIAVLSCCTVRMRAISRRASLSRVRVLERAGRRLEAQVEQLLARVGEALGELLVVRSRRSLASKEITAFTPHELRLERQLLPGEAQRLAWRAARARRPART